MFDDKHVREAIEAEAYLKGEAKGEAKGKAKIVKYLRSKGVSHKLLTAIQALK